MMCLCGEEFTPARTAKTCSPKCSAVRSARRQRKWRETHPEFKQATYHTPITRAVRLLFADKEENHA